MTRRFEVHGWWTGDDGAVGGGFVRAYRTMRHARIALRQWRRAFPDDRWRIRRA